MTEPIRILQVFASLNRGGAEAMIMNLYRKIDRGKIQFDFIANKSETEYAHEKEIKDLGGRIYFIPRYTITNYFEYKKSWINLLDNHQEWKIIHAHHTSPAFIYLPIAKQKERVTISHSHTAGIDKTLKSYTKAITRFPLRYKADYLFACSNKASKWMYGKKSKNAYLINNSIDASSFSLSESIRKETRQKLGLGEKFVIGHIGRFQSPKNHAFLIDIFSEIKKKNSDSILLLVGDGELENSIKEKVTSLGLYNDVIFLGVRSDIPELLSAMDVFLFPSFYEGLPVTLIEAQASGIISIISDTISNEVKLTNQVQSISLEENAEFWAKQVNMYANGYNRENTYKDIKDAGYDVTENANWIENFYLKEYSKIAR